MSTVSSQIQIAINEAISGQILLQIQATLKSGQGPIPERRWENPARRPEYRSGEALDRRFRSDSSDECYRFPNRNKDLESTHDNRCTKNIYKTTLLGCTVPIKVKTNCGEYK